jgi:hypothetical protein
MQKSQFFSQNIVDLFVNIKGFYIADKLKKDGTQIKELKLSHVTKRYTDNGNSREAQLLFRILEYYSKSLASVNIGKNVE